MQNPLRRVQKSIADYFEYLPVGPRELAWTLCVSAAGFARIAPGSAYPPPRHPEDHAFTWDRGRVLAGLQVLAVLDGSGSLEIRGHWQRVRAGSVFLLPPGTWHRYRPEPTTGWVEQWIELRGATVNSWLASGLLDLHPVAIPFDRRFWSTFEAVHRLCQDHPPGYRAIAAGHGMSLVASVIAESESSGTEPDTSARFLRESRRHLADGMSAGSVARELGVGYQTFYRRFKQATGLSPGDYAREVRLARAEELLSATDLSVKEIAARLGYFSASHFSIEFRKRRGVPPVRWPGRDKSSGIRREPVTADENEEPADDERLSPAASTR